MTEADDRSELLDQLTEVNAALARMGAPPRFLLSEAAHFDLANLRRAVMSSDDYANSVSEQMNEQLPRRRRRE